MDKKKITFEMKFPTDVPNENGYVYDMEAVKKAFERKEGELLFTSMQNRENVNVVPLNEVIGKIDKIDFDDKEIVATVEVKNTPEWNSIKDMLLDDEFRTANYTVGCVWEGTVEDGVMTPSDVKYGTLLSKRDSVNWPEIGKK